MQEGKEGIRRSQRLLQLSEKFFRKAGGNGNLRQAGSAGDKKLAGHQFRFRHSVLQLGRGQGSGWQADAAFFRAFPNEAAGGIPLEGFFAQVQILPFPQTDRQPGFQRFPAVRHTHGGCDIQLSVGEAEIPENAPQGGFLSFFHIIQQCVGL